MPKDNLGPRLTDAIHGVHRAAQACEDLALTCARFEGQAEALRIEITAAEERHATATNDAQELADALVVLQGLEAAWKKTFENALAEVVSRGLSIVLGEPMMVTLESEVTRGTSAVRFRITTGNGEDALTTEIMGSEGGSVVEIAAFLFRVLLILASRPPLRRVIVIDESFRMVAEERIPVLAQMIRELVDRLHLQVILVTHITAFGDAADVVFEATKPRTMKPGQGIPTGEVRRVKTSYEERT